MNINFKKSYFEHKSLINRSRSDKNQCYLLNWSSAAPPRLSVNQSLAAPLPPAFVSVFTLSQLPPSIEINFRFGALFVTFPKLQIILFTFLSIIIKSPNKFFLKRKDYFIFYTENVNKSNSFKWSAVILYKHDKFPSGTSRGFSMW